MDALAIFACGGKSREDEDDAGGSVGCVNLKNRGCVVTGTSLLVYGCRIDKSAILGCFFQAHQNVCGKSGYVF